MVQFFLPFGHQNNPVPSALWKTTTIFPGLCVWHCIGTQSGNHPPRTNVHIAPAEDKYGVVATTHGQDNKHWTTSLRFHRRLLGTPPTTGLPPNIPHRFPSPQAFLKILWPIPYFQTHWWSGLWTSSPTKFQDSPSISHISPQTISWTKTPSTPPPSQPGNKHAPFAPSQDKPKWNPKWDFKLT